MKIINLKEFLKLPPNTVFMKYEPCMFSELMVKKDSLDTNDFTYQDITTGINAKSSDELADILFDAEDGVNIEMDFNATARDGMFEESQLFAVYEQVDIGGLISKLQQCKGA